jgi:hypothetical protein
MDHLEESNATGQFNRGGLLTGSLKAGALLAGVAALAWCLARIVELGRAPALAASDLLSALALMFAAIALALLLWGVAEMLRKLADIRELLVNPATGAENEPAGARPAGRVEARSQSIEDLSTGLDELIKLTREVRDVSLLSEAERARRVQVQGQALLAALQQEIPALLQNHQWFEARRRIEQGRERFPGLAEWDHMEQQIEKMRGNVESRDVENATRQVNDLSALGAWERAAGVVTELAERHPNSPKVQELVRRVSIQRERADAEQRARLMAQAQEAVNLREWNKALTLSNDLLRRFPRSPEAEALRQQLPTLTENAEIQTRQQMESDFREQMKQRRYETALRLANELIERYPSSPQAEALRGQLPRLEEIAAGRK